MKIEYSRNLNGSFMIIKEADYLYEAYELLMLLNNEVPGLLQLQIIINEGKIEYWYEITGMTALEGKLGAETLRAGEMRCLIENIFDMNRGLDNYLLDGENICYLPEMVYYDRSLKKYRFCYLPGSRADDSLRLPQLMEYLLTKIDHTDSAAVTMGYTLYEKSMQESCSLQELLNCTACEENLKEESGGRDDEPEGDMELWDPASESPETGLQEYRGRDGRRMFLQKKRQRNRSIAY